MEIVLQKLKLKNGINIYYSDDEKFKTMSLSVCIYRRLDENSAKTALLGGVLKSACEKYKTKQEIEKHLGYMYGATLGANVRKKGDVQILSFTVTAPTDEYCGENVSEKLAGFLYEILKNPLFKNGSFDESIVAVEKENLKNRIYAMMNDKREYATYRCIGEMCKNEPYGIYELGTTEEINKISSKELKEHYETVLSGSRIDIFVMGKCNIDSIKSTFDEVYSAQEMPHTTTAKCPETVNYLEEKMNIAQGKLVIGMRADADCKKADFFDALLFNSVFGGGTHSKLFNNVREKLSLAYYAYSRLLRAKSIILVGTGIEFDKFEAAKSEIYVQLEEIQKGNISENELQQAKSSLINAYTSLYDSPLAMEDFYLGQLICGDESDVCDLISGVKNVTAAGIVEISKKVATDTVYFLKGTDK